MSVPKSKIKQNDEVSILAGRDKGQRGKVTRVIRRTTKGKKKLLHPQVYVVVEGINLVKKHVRPNPQLNQQGGIVEREAPIHVSNVAIINPTSDKPDRIGYKTLEDGRKVRVCKSNGEIVDVKE